MLIYREKDNLIHKLHPFTILAFIGVVLMLTLVLSHPVYLLGLFVAVGIVIIAADNYKEWKVYLKYCSALIVLIIIFNAIFSRVGETVLYKSPRLPLLGEIRITLEALAFGAGMGVRLLIIISVFCLYTYAIHPDKVLKLFNKGGSRSVLIIILATRLFPLLMKDFYRITEVQRCRGVKLDTGTRWKRIRNLLPVISVLLQSCLERSLQLAESMYARGYGSGDRSYYNRELWRPRDYLILVGMSMCLVIGVFSTLIGWSNYNYYPRLSGITGREIVITSIMTLTLMIPAILNWGWNKWPLLRSRI
ncbi:MAG: energy-coupling factor transporter transmembrane protein EcfT [Firmicutes bacterium HGW-Firmicutes-15]|nr:MAG: energy-coupling factor transporter transmembrane protein EcfT [Firmicutes bacterium HGW-Firmicutes-15]